MTCSKFGLQLGVVRTTIPVLIMAEDICRSQFYIRRSLGYNTMEEYKRIN